MTNGHIHVGDIGTLLTCFFRKADESAFDISAATTKEISFEKPDGTSFHRAGTFLVDGVDGVLTYGLAADDIDVEGYWWLQGHVVFGDGTDLRSDRVRVRIRKNNAPES